MSQPQTYANHRRFDPLFHFVLLPFLLIALVATGWHLFKYPSLHSLWMLLEVLAVVVIALKARTYAIRVQDRIIRLEERLRLEHLLPSELKARIPELTERQFVGLRFAADAEVADRMREALAEGLNDEGIKKRIQTWRPDTFRV